MASRITQQDVDLYGSLAQTAQQIPLQIDASQRDWEKQKTLWDQKTPSPVEEKRIKDSAKQTFDKYASIQKGAEKTLSELRGLICSFSSKGDKPSYKEKLEAPDILSSRKPLEDHETILETACQNINTSLPKARIALDALCQWKESMFAAGFNFFFGRPSHADSSSSSFSSRRSSIASASSAGTSSVKSMENDSDDDYVMVEQDEMNATKASKADETESSKAEARRQKNKAAHERAKLRKAQQY